MMHLRYLFRQNPALVTGIALPAFLLVLFLFSALIPRYMVDDPQYDVLFSIKHYDPDSEYEYKVEVVDHKVKVQGRKVSSNRGLAYSYQLYWYKAATGEVVEIPVPDKRITSTSWSTITLGDEARDLPVSDNFEAPDGYALHSDYRRTSDLGLLFFSGSQRSAIQIAKNGRIISIYPSTLKHTVYTPEFVGWVAEEQEEPTEDSES